MLTSVRGRIVVILVMVAGAIGYLWNTWDTCVEERRATGGEVESCTPVKLGLDLQGGMHLALGVDDPDGTMSVEAVSDAIDRVERIIRTRIDEFGVEEPLIQKVGNDRLIVELPGIRDEERAKDVIRRSAFLEFKLVLPTSSVDPALGRIDRAVVQALGPEGLAELGQPTGEEAPVSGEPSIEDLLFRSDTPSTGDPDPAMRPEGDGDPGTEDGRDATVDDTTEGAGDGVTGDTAAAEGADTATAGVGLDEESSRRPFTRLLRQGDVVGTYLVTTEDVPALQRMLALPEVQRAMPRNVVLVLGAEPVGMGARTYRYLYVLEDDPIITGDRLVNASAGRDPQFNQAQVEFEFSRAGGRVFERFTAQHIDDHMAIVLDDEVVSAPVIRARIGSRGVIEMGQSPMEEARDLALVLRAGALPVQLLILEERTVGPSLGQESIDQGKLAGLLGLALVLVVMIVYYRMAGVLAVGALAIYVLLVLGGLAAFGAALTLPGIAGLILSVGMAVDANVLIFERIREELDVGRATRTAVEEGFSHALSAIVDANITTLITALILFQFGTGPVRGFAVTLSIGIVASFFSALYVTRTFFLIYLRNKRASDPISI